MKWRSLLKKSKEMQKNMFNESLKEATKKTALKNLLKDENEISKEQELKYEKLKTSSDLLPGSKQSFTDIEKNLKIII